MTVRPWELLGRTRTPDGDELTFMRQNTEYLISANGRSLMSSRVYGSEASLAVLGCERARTLESPCVLVGGLGMGFTLRAALDLLPSTATVVVSELLEAVVEWNRGPLGALTSYPVDDPRVTIDVADIVATLRANPRPLRRHPGRCRQRPGGLHVTSQRAPLRRQGAGRLSRRAHRRGPARRLVGRRRSGVPAAAARRRLYGPRRTGARPRRQGRTEAHGVPRPGGLVTRSSLVVILPRGRIATAAGLLTARPSSARGCRRPTGTAS